jgi:hypothetical protein
MKNLTVAQKTYFGVLLAVAATWLMLEIGVPIYEYQHGESALTALLAHIAKVLKFAFFGIVALAFVLQRIGVLPTAQANPALENTIGYAFNPVKRLRNLAIWIVVALLLVFLFNLFQGTHPRGNVSAPPAAATPMPDLLTIFINWFPMLLIFGIWLVFLWQMKARQGNNDDKSNKF